MIPTILRLGPLTIYTYGFFLSLGILAGGFVFWQGALKQGFKEEKIFDFIILSVLGGILGSRLAFAILHSYLFTGGRILDAVKFWRAGSSWYGGLLGGTLVAFWFIRKEKWSLKKILSLVALAVPLGQTLGLSGVFLGAGGELAYLLEAVAFLILTIFLYIGARRFSSYLLGSLYLIFSSLTIFVASFFVKDRFLIGVLDVNQYLSLALLGFGVVAWESQIRLRTKMGTNIINPIKNILTKKEKELAKASKRLKGEDPLLQPDRASQNAEFVEDADEIAGHERVEASRNLLKSAIGQVNKALARLRIGKYGICEKCHRRIDPARLEVFPEATLCAECATAEETKNEKPKKGIRRVA